MKQTNRPVSGPSQASPPPDPLVENVPALPSAPEVAPVEQFVRVVIGYRGRRTQEQYIEPGLYPADHPMLWGLADFLVESGRAEWVEA